MKACQAWITSDEDIDEDVEAQMTQLFVHLAPILQTVSGSHWDFMFDLMENNLENCTFEDSSSIPTLFYTLRLLINVQELTRSSKMLRAAWKEREVALLSLVKNLVRGAKGTSCLSLNSLVTDEVSRNRFLPLKPSFVLLGNGFVNRSGPPAFSH